MSCTYANTVKNWKQKAATGEIMIGCATIESSKGLSCTDAESATYRNQFPTMTLITSIEYKQLHLFSTYVIRMAGRYAERLIWWLNAEIRHEQQKNLKRASREPTHFFRRINLCNFTKQYRLRSWPPMCQRKERSNAECQIHVLTTKSPVWAVLDDRIQVLNKQLHKSTRKWPNYHFPSFSHTVNKHQTHCALKYQHTELQIQRPQKS